GQGPGQAATRLKLDAGVIVVFDLCAERQTQPVGPQGHFILYEATEPSPGKAGGQKRQDRRVALVVVTRTVAEPPNNVMSSRHMKMVLKIGIVGAKVLDERARNVPVGSVVIQLQREIGVFG